MSIGRKLIAGLGALLLMLSLARPLYAQSAPADMSARLAKLEQQAADAKSSADNAWMLTSAALVLMMTGPGLALFYGGLVRKKNVLATMMQSFALMAVVTVLWGFFSYSLAFGAGNSFIGGWQNLFLHGVGAAPDPDYAATIPPQTFMVYQLMFAIITPALIAGAFAERMKFSAMLVFIILWSIFVYDPMAHMVWGKGGLLNASLGGRFPTLDFAGGTVVHITSGVSALVCALYLGKRVGYPKEPMPPHSVVLSFIGACLLVGGMVRIQRRQRAGRGQPGHQRIRGHALRRRRRGRGMGGGRVDAQRQAQRAGSDLGRGRRAGGDHSGGRICRAHVGAGHRADRRRLLLLDGRQGQKHVRLRRFAGRVRRARRGRNSGSDSDRRLRDQRDQSHLQGCAGKRDWPPGWLDGNAHQMLNQLVGVAIAWVLAIVGTLVILKIVDVTIGVRVSEEAGSAGPRSLATRRRRILLGSVGISA